MTGASRLIGDVFTNKIQITKIDAPTQSNGTSYGPGSSGQILKSNGTSVYWANDNNNTYSFTDKNVTLAWGTKSTIATVGGVDIHVTMPSNPNTNTDTLVKQTAKTDNVNYKLLGTATASPTSGHAAEAIYDANITINPSTHTITATNFAGNASTATAFSSNATVTLTGDTTGTSAGSTKSWSIATTTNQLSYKPQITTLADLDAFGKSGVNMKIAKISALDGHTGTLTKNDGMILALPWNGGYGHQFYIDDNSYGLHHRYWYTHKVNNVDTVDFNNWVQIIDSNNYTNYTVTKTGTGASGTWGINITGSSASCTGNASTATTLQTARNINGTSFNGSANITTANWGTARNISISDSDGTNTGAAVSVNGSAAVTLKLPATIKASLSGNATTATKVGTSVMWAYPENNNELNFGGTNNSSTIYFGYRAKDSKPIPTKFIFGGGSGSADLQAKTVYLGSGTTSYISSTQYTGNAATATKATQDGSGNVITSTYVKKTGDTMTGNLTLNKITGSSANYGDTLPATGTEGQIFFKTGSVETKVDTFYPVGSIYMSVNSTNPGGLFGGTWERIQNCFLLAAGSNYAAGSTGGEATHTLTVDEMPRHIHSYLGDYTSGGGTVQGEAWALQMTKGGDGVGSWIFGTDPGATGFGYTGNSQPHNNMPPYLAVYVWKRTA